MYLSKCKLKRLLNIECYTPFKTHKHTQCELVTEGICNIIELQQTLTHTRNVIFFSESLL